MLWNTLIPNHKWTTCSYIVVQYQCQSDGVEWAMGTLLGVAQRCISIQVWKRCDWTGPAIFWGPKLSTPKLAEAHYCTNCNGPVRNSKCRTRLLVPLLKKKRRKRWIQHLAISLKQHHSLPTWKDGPVWFGVAIVEFLARIFFERRILYVWSTK